VIHNLICMCSARFELGLVNLSISSKRFPMLSGVSVSCRKSLFPQNWGLLAAERSSMVFNQCKSMLKYKRDQKPVDLRPEATVQTCFFFRAFSLQLKVMEFTVRCAYSSCA
jgi:hypothetical protein